MKATTLALGLCSFVCFAANAQTAFQNLGFELADFSSPDPNGRYDIAQALPGWRAYTGSNPENLILYNNFYISVPTIMVVGPGAPSGLLANRILGQYSLGLSAPYFQDVSPPLGASVAQTGLGAGDRFIRALFWYRKSGQPRPVT